VLALDRFIVNFDDHFDGVALNALEGRASSRISFA
jgi:hypothetical protein